jgi:hypothetical protein
MKFGAESDKFCVDLLDMDYLRNLANSTTRNSLALTFTA